MAETNKNDNIVIDYEGEQKCQLCEGGIPYGVSATPLLESR
jgi:hypothetical protein